MPNNQRNNNNNNQRSDKQQHPIHERREYKDYGHTNERIEESGSTKNPPKER